MLPEEQKEEKIFDEQFPTTRLLQVIGDRWTSIVICALADGTKRYSDMQRIIPNISKKMLTQVLRNLEQDGLVERKVYPVVPPKTEYTLTQLGQQLFEPISRICVWAETHVEILDRIDAHRKKAY